MKHLLLFDIDGTLVKFRTRRSRSIFIEMFFDLFGIEIDQNNLPDFSGMTDLNIIYSIADSINFSRAEINSNIGRIWKYLIDKFRPITTKGNLELLRNVDVLLNTLNKSNNITLGLLTGNFKENAYLKLSVYGLTKYFPFGAFGDDNYDRNLLPPVVFERANIFAGDNMFSSQNSIIIGDSPRDIECAGTNDMKVLIVATGLFSRQDLSVKRPDIILNDFSDMSKTLDALESLGVSY